MILSKSLTRNSRNKLLLISGIRKSSKKILRIPSRIKIRIKEFFKLISKMMRNLWWIAMIKT